MRRPDAAACSGTKSINDTHGHLEGDNALCAIADSIKKSCSSRNVLVARWGGDEFVVMGFADEVGQPEELVASINENLREECQQRQIDYPLTVSIGYASTNDAIQTKIQLMEAADHMLYQLKNKDLLA